MKALLLGTVFLLSTQGSQAACLVCRLSDAGLVISEMESLDPLHESRFDLRAHTLRKK